MYSKMMKIQIFALSKPSKKITGAGIDHVDQNTTPREILARIAATYDSVIPNLDALNRDLIVDKTASIPRIALNDPVNEYFNGRQGDMYRIVDDSSTRFRMVAGSTVKNKTKTSPFHDVTADMYYSGYNTVLDMLKDRRSEEEHETVSEVDSLHITPKKMGEIFENEQFTQLDIKGIKNRRGQYMYVYFLQKDDETPVSRKRSAGAKRPFKALVAELLKSTVKHYNELTGEDLDVPSTEDVSRTQAFLDKIEVIVVYNNQQNESLVKLDVPAQFFSVQQLVFNVTKHMDQPSFYLLDPNMDRKEIVDVLSLNGLVLDKDKTLREFNIKDGSKLILL